MEIVHERLTAQLEGLIEVAKTLVSAADLPQLLDGVMQTIVRVVEHADVGAIMLWDHPRLTP